MMLAAGVADLSRFQKL